MIKCSKCNTLNSDNSKFCISCHAPLVGAPQYGTNKTEVATTTIECKKCGAINTNTSKFCVSCHEPLVEAPVYDKNGIDKNKNSKLGIVAFIFSFFAPLLGLILGFIEVKRKNGNKKTLALIAIVISIIVIIVHIKNYIATGAYYDMLTFDIIRSVWGL